MDNLKSKQLVHLWTQLQSSNKTIPLPFTCNLLTKKIMMVLISTCDFIVAIG